MTELTKEQLIEEAKLKIAIAKCHPNSGVARVEGELFKIALTSLEAEPAAWTDDEELRDIEKYGFGEIFQRPSDKYEASRCVTPLYRMPPVPVVPEGLVKAVRFYEQVKRENPPVETGAWKDAVDWVLKEACQVVNIRIKGE
ncbi:hypothetical protein QSE63_004957 [Escherichia coli]|uniref:Prophage protein n=2 Tax=Escherichia coli TaxID=562 RepID=A0A6L7A2L9_ECOLX|nr:hypothetical protein [Escherichia coli]EER0916521.1 hypothetical protein [Escherichia coli O168:H8]EES8554917.1 hypothetical protein [Escherichia coli O168]EHW0744169.1 hypothetical protein [Escherichia coli O48]EKF4439612.1 hypothetical protein [Escherichia coli O8]EEC8950863.1 hypothetical protein [Escherichia coli]